MSQGQSQRHNKDPLFGCLIGASPSMRKVFTQMEKIAGNHLPVFITGDTGTGKEKTAEAIHKYSKYSNGPFIPFHCAGHSLDMIDSALFGHKKGAFTNAVLNRDGAIKQAQGGTLFLDEICDMPRELQLKLLRFTQDNTYQPLGSDQFHTANIRIICATRRNTQTYVSEKKFREDLYYRLYVQPIYLPALNKRVNDIVDLALFFLRQTTDQNISLSAEAQKVLTSYNWPGNVRELKNTVESVSTQLDENTVQTHHLPETIKTKPPECVKPIDTFSAKMPLRIIEKNIIENTIHRCNGDVIRAASILEIAPSTIYRKKVQWQSW